MSIQAKIEVCIDSLSEAIHAANAGANRIEWCSALAQGGLTPDPGLTQELLKGIDSKCEVHAMIRPRAGDFNYSTQEFQAMKHNLDLFSNMGVNGVVYGFLDQQNELDLSKTKTFTEHAQLLDLHTTFHRAIDLCKNPKAAIMKLIDIGIDRVLTSGGKPAAIEGLNQIKAFIELAKDKIEIMPGRGIHPSNVNSFQEIGCTSIHFSCRARIDQIDDLGFGDQFVFDHDKFNAIKSELH